MPGDTSLVPVPPGFPRCPVPLSPFPQMPTPSIQPHTAVKLSAPRQNLSSATALNPPVPFNPLDGSQKQTSSAKHMPHTSTLQHQAWQVPTSRLCLLLPWRSYCCQAHFRQHHLHGSRSNPATSPEGLPPTAAPSTPGHGHALQSSSNSTASHVLVSVSPTHPCQGAHLTG